MDTETHLVFIDGTSEKFWRAVLLGTTVTTYWGRIGTVGQSQSKKFAEPHVAEAAFTKAVNEKKGKGYVEQGDAEAMPAAAPKTSLPEIRPMLAEEVDQGRLPTYAADDKVVFQQKLDGHRVMLHVSDGKVSVIGRGGQDSQHSPLFARDSHSSVTKLGDVVLDGELIGQTLWLFDMPFCRGIVAEASTYGDRMTALERLFEAWNPDPAAYRLLRTARTMEEKAELARDCLKDGMEGVMIKRLDAPYKAGKRVSTVMKAKFVKECDVVVTAVGVGGKDNYELGVYRDGELVNVGRCSAIGKAQVGVGAVIECRYLYFAVEDRLYQPRMMKVRTDKGATECLWSQFDHARVNKEVLA